MHHFKNHIPQLLKFSPKIFWRLHTIKNQLTENYRKGKNQLNCQQACHQSKLDFEHSFAVITVIILKLWMISFHRNNIIGNFQEKDGLYWIPTMNTGDFLHKFTKGLFRHKCVQLEQQHAYTSNCIPTPQTFQVMTITLKDMYTQSGQEVFLKRVCVTKQQSYSATTQILPLFSTLHFYHKVGTAHSMLLKL